MKEINSISEKLKPHGGTIKKTADDQAYLIAIGHGKFTDQLCEILEQVTPLEELLLYVTDISGSAFNRITNLTQLKKIAFLSCLGMNQVDLSKLGDIKTLRYLQIHDFELDSKTLNNLKNKSPLLEIT